MNAKTKPKTNNTISLELIGAAGGSSPSRPPLPSSDPG